MAAQIDLKNITVQFGQNKAVNDVSLEINKGDIYGVIGFSPRSSSNPLRYPAILNAWHGNPPMITSHSGIPYGSTVWMSLPSRGISG